MQTNLRLAYSYHSTDIPECECEIDDCSEGCENLFGTYTCYCPSGYIEGISLPNESYKSSAYSGHVAQLLMEGNWTIGESDLVAFITIDAIQGNSWNLKGYMFETEVNLMKLLLAMRVDFPLPDHTHYSINVSKVYGQYNAGDFIVLTFEGIIQAGNWFVDEGCLVVYQSLHRLSANSRPHAALATGCSGQVTITEYGNLLLPHYAWNIMGVDVSGLGFFSNLQLQDARCLCVPLTTISLTLYFCPLHCRMQYNC